MLVVLDELQPFSLSAVIRSHGWAGLAPFQTNDDRDELLYIDYLTLGKVVKLIIRQVGQEVHIEVDPPPNPDQQTEIKDHVTWMLGLKQDFNEFYELIREEPKLVHVIPAGRGRILRSPTLFEDTVKTILTTNTSWSGTKRMVRSLVAEYGDPLPREPEQRAFPRPERLSQASEEDLRGVGLGYRAPYVKALADAVNAGRLDLEALRTNDLPTDELRQKLLAIKGIGNYAAANLLMLLEHYDYLPVDSWARKMVSEEWYGGESVGKAEVLQAFEEWGQWKGLAYWFWDWDLE